MTSYDIIGDIHGHADALKSLLIKLGYERHGEGYRHSERRVVFVGDFIDRGPAIGEALRIARAMVDAGDAFAVMGNHEYNAIAFHTPQPGKAGKWYRPHSDKNLKQHQATLEQLSSQELGEAIAWFKTLPVAIEIDGIRVAHASWQVGDINCIQQSLTSLGDFTPDFLALSEQSDNELNKAIKNVLKGPELQMPAGHWIVDKSGDRRGTVRIKWYEEGNGRTYRQHHLGSDEVPELKIPVDALPEFEAYPAEHAPVFVGHYWLTGTPKPLADNVACTDYSVAKGGKLVAYRWDGERILSGNKFLWVDNLNQ